MPSAHGRIGLGTAGPLAFARSHPEASGDRRRSTVAEVVDRAHAHHVPTCLEDGADRPPVLRRSAPGARPDAAPTVVHRPTIARCRGRGSRSSRCARRTGHGRGPGRSARHRSAGSAGTRSSRAAWSWGGVDRARPRRFSTTSGSGVALAPRATAVIRNRPSGGDRHRIRHGVPESVVASSSAGRDTASPHVPSGRREIPRSRSKDRELDGIRSRTARGTADRQERPPCDARAVGGLRDRDRRRGRRGGVRIRIGEVARHRERGARGLRLGEARHIARGRGELEGAGRVGRPRDRPPGRSRRSDSPASRRRSRARLASRCRRRASRHPERCRARSREPSRRPRHPMRPP